MSSSEAYLDSLLDSILSGGKSEEEEGNALEDSQEPAVESKTTDGGKAMSPDEIEEMLMSMGTLGSGEEEPQEQTAEDMEAMLSFLDENNAEADDSDAVDELLGELDDFSMDDLSQNDLNPEEGGTDDLGMDEFSLDELSLDDLSFGTEGVEDGSLDDDMTDLSLDDTEPEEGGADDFNMDDLALDELSLDDLASEEAGMNGGDADDLALADMDAEESGSDDFALDEFSLDDLSLDDFSSEESANTEEDTDDLMSEEDIDRLLSGELPEEAVDDFALEDTGDGGDDDLSALLAGMGHDEDLSEISDLLEESDQGVSADDDMLAMLEGADEDGSFDLFENDEAAREAESIRELSPEEVAEREGGDGGKKKKKRKKLFGRKKKGGDEESVAEETGAAEEDVKDELEALLGEVSADQEEPEKAPQGEKKPGFIAKLMNLLLESEEDEDPVAAEVLAGNEGETGMITDENRKLLQELNDEDKKGKKKKKKDKKGKKGKEEAEDDKKPKKQKKPKKVKQKKEKKKSEEGEDLFAPPQRPLSKKKVITVFLFCATIAACIIVVCIILPDSMQKQEAVTAYDQGEYADVYQLLYGKKLNEQEEVIFQGSNLVLQMSRRLSSYNNYVNLDMRVEALDALLAGVERYHEILPEAENYNVVSEVNEIYVQILGTLSANFGLSEQDALNILASEDDVTYTRRLNAIINGEYYDDSEEEAGETGIQDMLPEEEEIMERIGVIDGESEVEFAPEDTSTEDAAPEDALADDEMADDQAGDENFDEGAE